MSTNQEFTLEILEPKGVLANPKRESLSVPRLKDLNGKTIALLSVHANGGAQYGSELFFNELEVLFKKDYPDIKFYRGSSFGSPKWPDNSKELATFCDGWVEGVKDAISQGLRDVGSYMERAGVPGVSICSDVLLPHKLALADFNGCPKARVVTVEATDYCTAKLEADLMREVVAAVYPDIVRALTAPLTEEEMNVSDVNYDYSPKQFTGANYSEAYEKFMEYCSDNVLGDGLALAPPTKEAVEWMLSGTSYPRDKVIGLMYPKSGSATVEKIAICAVMAGAKPEWLPIIITIIETITAKDFNQFHIVNEILPIIFISGPIIKELGINNKVGYLAPGHRVNSTIGRAILLCMISIGWRDMAIYSSPGGPGRPAAYANYFIVENQEENPWSSWAEENGYGSDESVITVCESTKESRGPAEVMSNADFKQRLAQISGFFKWNSTTGIFSSFGMPANAENCRHMVVLHPTMARQLQNAGYTKESFIKFLYDDNVVDWDLMTEEQREKLKADLAGVDGSAKMFSFGAEDVKPGLHREPFHVPSDVMVMVAGSGAGNTALFQTTSGSTSDAEDVEVTRPFMIKTIHGATLTKYGR